jgi:hypothetical protein
MQPGERAGIKAGKRGIPGERHPPTAPRLLGSAPAPGRMAPAAVAVAPGKVPRSETGRRVEEETP